MMVFFKDGFNVRLQCFPVCLTAELMEGKYDGLRNGIKPFRKRICKEEAIVKVLS
jgi:hypothetical protein